MDEAASSQQNLSQIYSLEEVNAINALEKAQHSIAFTLLCSKVCFKDYAS